jgi:hypothetical protein
VSALRASARACGPCACASFVAATIRANGLADRVSVQHTGNISELSEAFGRIDLVVANPPHFANCSTSWQLEHIMLADGTPIRSDDIRQDGNEHRTCDHDWNLHRSFYAAIPAKLTPDANVLILENAVGSDADSFLPMLPPSLMFLRAFQETRQAVAFKYYWFHALHTEGT